MSLETWAKNGWLRPHKITRQEIADLIGIVERDLKDARRDLSADWKFGIAYNAALQLCTILLNASGYRPEKLQAHYRTLQSLPLILGADRKETGITSTPAARRATRRSTIQPAVRAKLTPKN